MPTVQQTKKKIRESDVMLDVRLDKKTKKVIEQAALASSQTFTDFVVASLLRAAEETLRQHHIIRLSNRDRDLFLAALETEEKPNKELKKA